jgi:hypothetical protein
VEGFRPPPPTWALAPAPPNTHTHTRRPHPLFLHLASVTPVITTMPVNMSIPIYISPSIRHGDRVSRVPFHRIQPDDGFEITVIGLGLRVFRFEEIADGVQLTTNGPQETAYQLIYSYQKRGRPSREIHVVYFLGGKPDLCFLWEDDSGPTEGPPPPIVEYALVQRRRRQVGLRVVHPDVTRDTDRAPFGVSPDISEPTGFLFIRSMV